MDFKYAGFWVRAAALIIDAVILFIPAAAMGSALPVLGGVLAHFLYMPIFESSPLQATPGKALMGLQVFSEPGERLSLKKAFIRSIFIYLSGFLLCIGFLMNLFTRKRQTLHDLIAETVVVVQTPPDLNYIQVWLQALKDLFKSDFVVVSEGTSNSQPGVKPSQTLEEIHELYRKGILTEEEYQKKKNEILNRL